MKYVFDTSSLIILFKHFYPDNFPSLWKKFNQSVDQGIFFSVKEVKREIIIFYNNDRLKNWTKTHKNFFQSPNADEVQFMTKMFSEFPHFKNLVNSKSILGGKPVADPFVIAKAHIFKSCVVSEEKFKKNAVKIPNVCHQFNIPHINL